MFCLGGFCPGGVLSRGFLSGGLCPGGLCPGGFVWGVFVLEPYILCKHIIQGTRRIETKKRKDLLDRSASLLARHMVHALKTDRQVSYEPKNQSANFGITKETPLSVAVPLTIHKKTRLNNWCNGCLLALVLISTPN